MARPEGFGQKAAFIRGQPADMPPREVVAAAAKEGIKISETHVYKLRSAAKQTAAKKRGPRREPGRPPKALPDAAAKPANGLTKSDAELLRAIAAIGLDRARELFARVEAAFAGLGSC